MRNKILSLILILIGHQVLATHLRGGWISVTQLSSSSKTCKITVTVFTDTQSGVLFGGSQDYLNFGDGSDPDGDGIPGILVPETPNSPLPGGYGAEFGTASFTILHTYPSSGRYVVSYQEPNRNEGVINMDNSVLTTFYTETILYIDPLFGVTITPELLVSPIFKAKSGENFSMSVGASVDEDYILTYDLTVPKRDNLVPVSNYRLPENFAINPFNGLITWDTKFMEQYPIGEFSFAVQINVSKEIDGFVYRLTTVVLDFQIIVTDELPDGGLSDNIDTDENGRVYIPNDETKHFKVFYETSFTPASEVELSAYSSLAENSDVFSFTTYDSSTNENIKVGVLTLTTEASILRDNPYPITIRGKNGAFATDICYLFYTKDLYPQVITGTEQGESLHVEVFPNPVVDFATISLSENQKGTCAIYDQAGKLISNHFIEEKTSIDMRSYPSGLYYGRVQTRSYVKMIKLIRR